MKVVGTNDNGDAVRGTSTAGGAGVRGVAEGDKRIGVRGEAKPSSKNGSGTGVVGTTTKGTGVFGTSDGGGPGVHAVSNDKNHAAVLGINAKGGPAGNFDGNVHVTGQVNVVAKSGDLGVQLDGNTSKIVVGRKKSAGQISVVDAKGKLIISIDGDQGDVVLHNGDCAEEFDVESTLVEPGTVMVIARDGKLQESDRAYDTKVAGIVAGAADCRPAIVLGRQPGAGARMPVALAGRVFCRVEAEGAPIAVGDLLTSSSIKGHAMKAVDPARAFGAVIGKALQPLSSGRGLIAVLVSLQ